MDDFEIGENTTHYNGKLVANWIVEKSLLLRYNDELYLRLWIKNEEFEDTIVVKANKFTDVKSFNFIIGTRGFYWKGSNQSLILFSEKLLKQQKFPIEATIMIGRDPSGKGWTDWDSDNFLPVVHPLDGCLTDEETDKKSLKNILTRLIKIHPKKISALIGWFAASPFAVPIRTKYELFPLLIIAGEQGSGKTDVMKTLLQLFGWNKDLFGYSNTSNFVFGFRLSCTNAYPLVFDEAKTRDASKDEILKACVAGEKLDKGTWSGQPGIVNLDLRAPVALIGESVLQDPALIERSLIVELDRSGRTSISEWTELRRLKKIGFLFDYMKWACSKDLPDGPPVDRSDMGKHVVEIGLHFLEEYLSEKYNLEFVFPKPEWGTFITPPPADNALIFVNQLLKLHRNGKTDRNWVWIKNGELCFHLNQCWDLVSERSQRVGIDVLNVREISKILNSKPYCKSGNRDHPIKKKKQLWVRIIDLKAVEKLIGELIADLGPT